MALVVHACEQLPVVEDRGHVTQNGSPRLLLLLSLSLSPLCRVFVHIFLRQTMSLGNTAFQLFSHYYLWCLYR